MKHFLRALTPVLLAGQMAVAQPQPVAYSDYNQLTARLRALAGRSGGAAAVQSIGKSVEGKDIWLLTLGPGNAAGKPALAIMAGVEGSHLAGTELAVQLAEKLIAAQSDSVRRVLASKTIYVIPLINPDAQAQAFARLRHERSGNGHDTDDDRDGRLNEDPAEDLNRDGRITQVRIEDPTGQYVPSATDPRVLVKADPAKGEVGRYVLISEGIDNDKDGQFNEDGPGGVALDKNFTFDYPFFTPGSGEMPMSEPENRALMDFLYRQPNIYAVLTLGPYNNLSEAPKFVRDKTTKRVITGLLEKDATVGEQVSKLYNAQTGLTGAPAMPATRGNFAQTAYFHYGRLSFGTPGWWVPKAPAPARKDSGNVVGPTGQTPDSRPPTTSARSAAPGSTTSGPASTAAASTTLSAGEDELRYLKWADANNVVDNYVVWTAIEHPDFPGRRAEVGGLVPFARLNPPVRFLADAADKHLRFVTALAARMPTIEIANVRTESLGGGLSRITAQIVNRGLLPTGAEIGERVRFVPKMRVELKLANNQSVVSGRRLILRGPMAAGETMDVTFLVTGSGRVTLEAGNAMTGIQRTDLTLN